LYLETADGVIFPSTLYYPLAAASFPESPLRICYASTSNSLTRCNRHQSRARHASNTKIIISSSRLHELGIGSVPIADQYSGASSRLCIQRSRSNIFGSCQNSFRLLTSCTRTSHGSS